VTANAKTTRGIGKIFSTLLILETAKENAGLLRATMSSLLAANRPIAENALRNLFDFKAKVDANLSSPAMVLSAKSASALSEYRNSKPWQEVDRVFALMVGKAGEGKFGVDAGGFFASITRQIDDIGGICQGETETINNKLGSVQEEVSSEFRFDMLAFALTLFLTLAMTFFVFRSAMQPIRQLTAEFQRVREAALRGELSERGLPERINFEFRSIIIGANEILEALIAPMTRAVEVLNGIGRGEIPPKIEDVSYGDFNTLKESLNACIDNINALVHDANRLAGAAVKGELSARADASRHSGDYRKIIEGVNAAMEAVIGPLNKAADCVRKISKGDIPPKITEGFSGDFDALKKSLNVCIENIQSLVTDANMLAEAAVAGKLSTRVDAAKHSGDFRKIIEGVNGVMDAVVGPLGKAAVCIDRISKGDMPPKIPGTFSGDFNTLINNINVCIDNIFALVADANMLARAGIEGRLSTRAETKKHNGEFGKIVGGVNSALDAFIGPLKESAECLAAMAGGDLDIAVAGDYPGDHSIVKNALNTTLDSFNEILRQVQAAAAQVYSGASQVADSSMSLSQGATEQAASLEEITSSMTELASQTKINAENAAHANKLALGTRESAMQGAKQMQETVAAMNEIKEASENIAKIIKVIDAIAFQTNLLALNAAVEAARAGKHGKGFAVVAEEVRSLAGRSAKAAREISELIEGSVRKVETGSMMAGRSGESLNEIVAAVVKVSDLIGEIATASNEQAQGIGQINQGLSQIDNVTQQNSANAEETASASEELSEQALSLDRTLSRFKLRNHDHANDLAPVAGPASQRVSARKAPKSLPPGAGTPAAMEWGGSVRKTKGILQTGSGDVSPPKGADFGDDW
jgi:methyl-accepting chemotaxis protein